MAGISGTAVLAPEKRQQISVTQSRGRAEGEEGPKQHQEFILLQSVLQSQLQPRRGLNAQGREEGPFPNMHSLQPSSGWPNLNMACSFLQSWFLSRQYRQRLKAALKRKEHGS